MNFVVENKTTSSGRIGRLEHSETGTSVQTPLLIQCTKGGSIPHLSQEVFKYVTPESPILLLSLSNITYMAEALKVFKKGISSFVGYPNSLNILTIRDICETTPSGFNDKDIVPLFTRRGKEPLSAQQYMTLVEAISPDIYIGLYDADTNEESSKKRVQKSVERTEVFFNYCYEKHTNSSNLSKKSIFAPVVGGFNKFSRSLSIKKIKEKPQVAGYVLDGFHNNGLSATTVSCTSLLEIVQHCVSELDVDKPKMVMGAYTPLVVAELVRLGVDIFDTSYAYEATSNFKALIFNFNKENTGPNKPMLEISDKELKEDFTPILENCKCEACKQHTRAYIHHLYNTKELLGPILLMIHNLHHYMEFFKTLRTAVMDDSLSNLIDLLRFQGTDKEIDYSITELPKLINKGDEKKAMFREMATTQ
ncbi:queuine tRNA-ribosyltransferase accessory subunit 2 [Episyrphus balteatus]|uniref:queuine tRNA-ribosyltransferase accessory subunit 2 n=1 Tax=Episyrphus balteatus TaxID=286459 RepID=UPI002485FAAE|nr:queuine tRNA-ribosyltransferase accessory subunit 2 [Episyrphus balteatus]